MTLQEENRSALAQEPLCNRCTQIVNARFGSPEFQAQLRKAELFGELLHSLTDLEHLAEVMRGRQYANMSLTALMWETLGQRCHDAREVLRKCREVEA